MDKLYWYNFFSKNIVMAKTRRRNKTKNKTYTKKDYESGDGMVTRIWGPWAWCFLHTISFNYPAHPTKEQKKQYRDFILSLQHVLPCGHCRKNLTKNLKKHPLTMRDMKSRETFSRWLYALHAQIVLVSKPTRGTLHKIKHQQRRQHLPPMTLASNKHIVFFDLCLKLRAGLMHA